MKALNFDTSSRQYFERLVTQQNSLWKKMLNVQLPYRKHIQWLCKGKTLDIGCGIGRHLTVLERDSIGMDHNKYCVDYLVERGFKAFTASEFKSWLTTNTYYADNLLLAHILEHLADNEMQYLFREYLPVLKENGKIVIITPQRAGYRKDPTHKTFLDFDKIKQLAPRIGCKIQNQYCFPFFQQVGEFFPYNEYVSILTKVHPQ